jgi:hypothetical protein
MPLSPPFPAVPGEPFILSFEFRSYEGGALTDPATLTLDVTYGEEVGFVPDVTGPFTWIGNTAEASDTIWRTGTGQYSFRWDVPVSGLLPGVYVANWTATYGTEGDQFLSVENFPIETGAPFEAVTSGDTGYWRGSLSYQPSWASAAFTIPLGSVDGNGITWTLEKVTGWDSAPSVGSVIQRSADHGGWPAAQYYGPRIITLTVMASAPTQAQRDTARALMQQAVAIGTSSSDLTTFTYNEPVPKQAAVRRNASASVTETYPTLADVEFTVPLVAPDMRKYSTVQQSEQIVLPAPPAGMTLPFTMPVTFPGGLPAESNALTITNDGTFETRPSLTVTGPVVNPQVTNGTYGQAVSFSGLNLGATDTLTLDMDNRQSFVNSTFYPADPFSAWWVLNPGSNLIFLNGNTPGGATLSITWRSAWQ